MPIKNITLVFIFEKLDSKPHVRRMTSRRSLYRSSIIEINNFVQVLPIGSKARPGPVNSALFGANDLIARIKFTFGWQTGFLITFVMVISLISGLYDPMSTTKSESELSQQKLTSFMLMKETVCLKIVTNISVAKTYNLVNQGVYDPVSSFRSHQNWVH